MSDVEKVVDEKVLENSAEKEPVSVLDNLLNEKEKRKPIVDPIEEVEKKAQKQVEQPKKQKDEKSATENQKETASKPSNNTSEKKSEKVNVDEDDEREIEITKLRKALNDSQKWGHTNNKRLKSVVKIVDSLKESGILNDDEFNSLNNLLSSESEPPEIEGKEVNATPLKKMIDKAANRLQDLKSVYEDPLFDKKIQAFDFLIQGMTEEERDNLSDELSEIGDNDFKLVKKMYQIGEEYYNENYKELDEAGGLKELLTAKNDEIKRLQRKIDKLERKVLESNDYDTPTNKIDESADAVKPEKASIHKPNDVLGGLLERRDRSNRQ